MLCASRKGEAVWGSQALHAADDPGLGEGGVGRGGGGGRGPGGLGVGDHDVPLHRRHTRFLLVRFPFSLSRRRRCWLWWELLSSDLRRAAGAERLPDGRRRLHFAGPIGGDGPSIRICIRDWNLNAEWADSPNRKQAVNSEPVQWATVVAGLASSSYQGGQGTYVLRHSPKLVWALFRLQIFAIWTL